jgi:hypothetical protein
VVDSHQPSLEPIGEFGGAVEVLGENVTGPRHARQGAIVDQSHHLGQTLYERVVDAPRQDAVGGDAGLAARVATVSEDQELVVGDALGQGVAAGHGHLVVKAAGDERAHPDDVGVNA